MLIKQVPLTGYIENSESEMFKRSDDFFLFMKRRRTVRQFSPARIPPEIIDQCIRTAGTAPSGANLQPWHFVIVTDPQKKRLIRQYAEEEEHEFYTRRAPQEWLDVLAPLGTNEHKPFLETAPHLIVIFEKKFEMLKNREKMKYYYSKESVGIASGLLIAAVHNAGLASLTHTPSSMNFLNKLLERPKSEKPFLILVVGYPVQNAMVPEIKRKDLKDITSYF